MDQFFLGDQFGYPAADYRCGAGPIQAKRTNLTVSDFIKLPWTNLPYNVPYFVRYQKRSIMEISANDTLPLSRAPATLLEIESILTEEALRGLADIAAGRTRHAEDFLLEIIARRAANTGK